MIAALVRVAIERLRPGWVLERHARGECRLDSARLGRVGELYAARALAKEGLFVAAQRLETRGGELDLVLRDRDELLVVEVKTGRLGPRFRPGDRLDAQRVNRLVKAARRLAPHLKAASWRVELFEVGLTDAGAIEATRRVVGGASAEAYAWRRT